MDRGDLADLNTFLAVAEHLSFRAAAAQLGVTPSALSHSIRQLEARLGVKLLHRTTRSVSLTDAGRRLRERLRPGMEQISDALEELKDEGRRPFGRLRINATEAAAAMVIAPVWAKFASEFPQVHLEICADSGPVDIVTRGIDAGISVRNRIPAEMIAVRVTEPLQAVIVANSTYLARHPAPQIPEDILSHSCILFRWEDGELYRWQFEREGSKKILSVRGNLTINAPALAVQAAVDGLGLTYTIENLAEPFLRAGKLVRVLPGWLPRLEALYLYYQGRRQPPAALRALIEMIRARG